MKYYPAPWTREETQAAIERNLKRYADTGHGLWMVVSKSTGETVGDCGLLRQEVPWGAEVEVAYHLRREHWGKGYATEASRGCMRYGFEQVGAERLISLIRPENLPSRKVAERNGLTVIDDIIWRGLRHLVYAITRDRWSAICS